MIKRILLWAVSLSAALLLVGGGILVVVLFFRSDPLGPFPGERLEGEEAAFPDDWSWTDEFLSLEIETRPSRPYSVTTTFFRSGESLYVPSVFTETSRWSGYLLEDPRVRFRINGKVYRGKAFRVRDPGIIQDLVEEYGEKYPRLWESRTREEVLGFWYFRLDPGDR